MTLGKSIRYKIEAFFLYVFYGIFWLLPVDIASAIGGWILKIIGPRLAASRKAYRNLQNALPDKTEKEYREIVTGMWENLGRVFAEYPHLKKISKERVEIVNYDYLHALIHQNTPIILFSAHIANWEVIGPSFWTQHQQKGLLVYRPPNNPTADKLLLNARNIDSQLDFTTKSDKGLRDMVSHLKKNKMIGLLIDQKFNRGLPVNFFGQAAMTSPAFIELSKKFNAKIIPIQIERLKGVHFRLTIHQEFDHQEKTVEDALLNTHLMMEEWIQKAPEQWLWIHKRWRDF